MFIKRTTFALCMIVLVLGLVTACAQSTPVPPAVTPPPAMVPMGPGTTLAQPSGSPADDNWLIRVANSEQDAAAGTAPQVVSQPHTTQAITTSPADENWLVRVANGE
jgi:hypothetical protein